MKHNLLATALAVALLGAADPTLSQFVQPGRMEDASTQKATRDAARNAARAVNQKKWDDYLDVKAGRGSQGDFLAGMLATGLAPTKANADSVVQLLESSKTDKADRVMLVLLAGALHGDLDETGDKASKGKIREAVARVAKNDADPKTRREATLTHNRMDNFPESLPLLRQKVPLLGDISYHQELAHMMLAAPGDDQVKIINEIASGEGHNNQLGKSVLAELMLDPNLVNKALAPQAVAPLLALLTKTEPGFNQQDPKAMGWGGLQDYYEWLGAVANLTARATGEAPRYTVARLLKLDGDPRRLVAAFDNERIAALVRSSFAAKDLDRIDATLIAFAAKYPDNGTVQRFTKASRDNIYEKPAAKKGPKGARLSPDLL